MPPSRIHFAASSIASRCGAPGSTNTRRIACQRRPGASTVIRRRTATASAAKTTASTKNTIRRTGAADEAGDERAARHADQRRAGEHAEAGAVRAGRNHRAGGAIARRHRRADADAEHQRGGAHDPEVARDRRTRRRRLPAIAIPPAITTRPA